ncbi:ABC transporter substrate-binding protein [Pseudaminobacter sp. NGMCC 1.201702]|uniref:ABC transporter substrate-binding protein n=1 Tax=Pseudaminobacter sp. NGMCC 1.201702 TaxID=3391825 RepID=UPI0039F05E63
MRFIERSGTSLLLAALAGLFLAASAMAEPAPRRVVSLNVCTDQLAMLIAGEGQLHSVSFLARDSGTSAMAAEAQRYVINHSQAEEIFLMQPDLVLAGTFSSRPTIDLLRRLGFRVEEFAPARSFEDVRENLTRVGRLLHREIRAAELVADLDGGLAGLRDAKVPPRTIALYEANSYTSGTGTLTDAIFRAAGLTNIAEKLGVAGTVRLPMELLIMADPDLIAASNRDYGAPALAQENFTHPAYLALGAQERTVNVPVPNMICGGPFTLEAARILQEAASMPIGNVK